MADEKPPVNGQPCAHVTRNDSGLCTLSVGVYVGGFLLVTGQVIFDRKQANEFFSGALEIVTAPLDDGVKPEWLKSSGS